MSEVEDALNAISHPNARRFSFGRRESILLASEDGYSSDNFSSYGPSRRGSEFGLQTPAFRQPIYETTHEDGGPEASDSDHDISPVGPSEVGEYEEGRDHEETQPLFRMPVYDGTGAEVLDVDSLPKKRNVAGRRSMLSFDLTSSTSTLPGPASPLSAEAPRQLFPPQPRQHWQQPHHLRYNRPTAQESKSSFIRRGTFGALGSDDEDIVEEDEEDEDITHPMRRTSMTWPRVSFSMHKHSILQAFRRRISVQRTFRRQSLLISLFQYSFYVLTVGSLYFLFVGRPCWNGLVYWLYVAMENRVVFAWEASVIAALGIL
jgi:hypothetical protein